MRKSFVQNILHTVLSNTQMVRFAGLNAIYAKRMEAGNDKGEEHMTKHTPGPWELIETPHEKIISNWHVQVGEHQIPVHPYKRIWNEDRTQSGLVTDHQHMADARLIAAAPDLLEALRDILEGTRLDEFNRNDDGLLDDGGYNFTKRIAAARAAIAKATGETK